MTAEERENKRWPAQLKERIDRSVIQIKTLRGDPHYIALGMGIGVFVGITPTIPFHTALAIALALIVKGSKPAAAIGVWIANPLTIPIFYVGGYRMGSMILGKPTAFDPTVHSISELLQLGWDVILAIFSPAMIVGGIVLGIVPGILAYLLTRLLFTAIRSRRKA